MSSKFQILTEKVNHYKLYLDATKKISSALEVIDDEASLENISKNLEIRNELIEKIDALNIQYKVATDIAKTQDDEFQKLNWLCNAIIKETAELDRKNQLEMSKVFKGYASNVKNTKESIRVINAYTQNSYNE